MYLLNFRLCCEICLYHIPQWSNVNRVISYSSLVSIRIYWLFITRRPHIGQVNGCYIKSEMIKKYCGVYSKASISGISTCARVEEKSLASYVDVKLHITLLLLPCWCAEWQKRKTFRYPITLNTFIYILCLSAKIQIYSLDTATDWVDGNGNKNTYFHQRQLRDLSSE